MPTGPFAFPARKAEAVLALLAALPPGEWQRWSSLLESVEMPLDSVLYESGQTLSHIYRAAGARLRVLCGCQEGV